MVKKRIIVVDDEPLIGVLMKEIVEEDAGLEITQMTTEKNKFLDLITHHSFDIALVDISVGGREGGLELLQTVKNRGIDLPIVMLSAHDELHYALKCLKSGARGYMNKRYICTDIVTCLKQVLAGYFFVSGNKGAYILEQYRRLNIPANQPA